MNIIPTIADLSRDSAKYSSETLLGMRPAASAARISEGTVIAVVQMSDMAELNGVYR
jgi:hypothetical protein